MKQTNNNYILMTRFQIDQYDLVEIEEHGLYISKIDNYKNYYFDIIPFLENDDLYCVFIFNR